MKKSFKKTLCAFLSVSMVFGNLMTNGIYVSAEEVKGTDAVSSATVSKFSNELNFKSAKSYGGLYEDKFEGAAYLKTKNGEEESAFVAVGYTFGESNDPEWTFSANDSYGKYRHSYNEALIVRYDEKHDVDWVWTASRVGVSYFLAVDVLEDGRIVAVGRARDPESTTVAMEIVVINPDDPSDYTEYAIQGGYEFRDIVATKDGGFAAVGYAAGSDGYILERTSSENSFTKVAQAWQGVDGKIESVNAKRASSKGFNGVLMKFDKDINMQFTSLESIGATEDGAADPKYSSISQKFSGVTEDAEGNFVTVGVANVSKYNQNAVISKWNGENGKLIAHKTAGTATPAATESILRSKSEYLGIDTLKDGSFVVTGVTTNDATTDEAWKCYGSTDVVVVRYSADLSEVEYAQNIGTVDGLSGSLTANNGTQLEGVKATSDGGYVLYGTSNTTLIEGDLLSKGFDWDNYGSNDGVIVKCDADNNVSWAKNYGTTAGDWIYDVIFRENETEVTVVGQSSGQYGTPSWSWHGQAASSTNPYDAFVMCTNYYEAAYTESKASSTLSGVTWANGTYTGEGTGRGGVMKFEVTVANNMISSVVCTSQSETPSVYEKASVLYDTIVNQQSAEVDAVSGATLSSAGIKSGVTQALAKASAQTAINAITKIEGYTAKNTSTTGNVNNVLAAINYYTSLTDYEREFVTNADKLYEIADIFGFEIEIEESAEENKKEALDTTLNDTYWNLQSKYYKNISANALAEHGLSGEGVKIAVIDSGLIGNSADLDYSHILAGYDYVNDCPMNDTQSANNEALIDELGHGTMVAGIIGAIRDNNVGIAGLLSKADLIPLRCSSAFTEDTSIKFAQIIRDAIDTYGADVITTSISLVDTEELQEAVKYAKEKGVIILAASGNSGVSGSVSDDYIYPASYDDVISVGAVDSTGTIRANSTKNDKLDVAAPGQQVVSLGISARGYRCSVKSGTSYASPVVAAMAAAAKQVSANMTVDEFRDVLIETSQDKGDEGYDNAYGYGLVDFAAFAEKLAPAAEGTTEGGTPSGNETPSGNGTPSGNETISGNVTPSENEAISGNKAVSEVSRNSANASAAGWTVSAGEVKIGDTAYKVEYNQSVLTFNGRSLKKSLKDCLTFKDDAGNVKEIKSIAVKNAKKAGKVTLTKVRFKDGTLLKKSALSGLDINIAAREVSANAVNANGAVTYAKAVSAKVNKSGKKVTVKVELAQWKKNASDISEASVKKYVTKKISKNDIESFEVKENTVTVNFKNNYAGSAVLELR